MNNNKLETITNLFEGAQIRSVWDNNKEDYYFSVVDVISALTTGDYQKSRNYWKWLKGKLIDEGSELVSKTNQLKMKAQDGKFRETDVLDTKGILRLIESVPSQKAEPFKLWLASLGSERIDEVFDPERAIARGIDYYRKKGYDDAWIEARIKGMINRKKLTDAWKDAGVTEGYEYVQLTNEIYKEWSGMTAKEYKDFKSLRKESLRDNMSDLEVALTDLGEIATRELVKTHKPHGLKENKEMAKAGGNVAKVAKDNLEEKLGKPVITKQNNLAYKYVDNEKLIEDEKQAITFARERLIDML